MNTYTYIHANQIHSNLQPSLIETRYTATASKCDRCTEYRLTCLPAALNKIQIKNAILYVSPKGMCAVLSVYGYVYACIHVCHPFIHP